MRLQIIARDCYTCIGALLPETVGFLVVELARRGLLDGEVSRALNSADFQAISALTIEGWNRYDDIVRHGGVGSRAFIAMPFGRADLEAHWLPIVRLAVKDVGFQLRRLDDQPRSGIIDVRMRQEIKDARFVIVELTRANHGAYWEAGYAEGLGKPVIYTCRKGETNIHFDAAHLQ